ncbi:MAG: hypothetical protein F2793_09910 [Actinobacteria bacterium]|uniref:Unannotated protein n=1 Tax=freshwater metagenome TaxID=449393 RepID=A0A6J7EZJ9_9ZZZZ|nr:hypothetical protein [Actinomycetota bacterium]
MINGPLIPGLREFDGPRRRLPRLVWLLLAAVVVAGCVVLALGVFSASGPMRSLGLVTDEMQTVAYRPTTTDLVIQVAVALPPEGICRSDDLTLEGSEVGSRIEVRATRTTPRNSVCQPVSSSAEQMWIDVVLDSPLADRSVVRASDLQALPRDTSAGLS